MRYEREPANPTRAEIDDLRRTKPRSKETVCAGCGVTYDSTAFGAGWKYCTAHCRNTRGGIYKLRTVCGRPRRFPSMIREQQLLLRHWLAERNWILFHWRGRNGEEDEQRVVADRGSWLTVNVTLGGNQRAERWADCVIYYNREGKVRITSTCAKEVTTLRVPNPRGEGTVTRTRRVACNRESCRKCLRTELMKRFSAEAKILPPTTS